MSEDRIDALLRERCRPEALPAGYARRILDASRERRRDLTRLADAFVIESTERGVVRVRLGGRAAATGGGARRLATRAREEIFEYLAGQRTFFSVPCDLSPLGEFPRRVLEATASVPFGEVRPYAWVAERIGRPRAVRAVGTALGRNPVPLIVPCHRVVRSDGDPGEYSLGQGRDLKRRLLALEGTTPLFEGCSTTRIVCRVGCPAGRRMRPEHRVVFASVADARSVGYRTCRVCRPLAAA